MRPNIRSCVAHQQVAKCHKSPNKSNNSENVDFGLNHHLMKLSQNGSNTPQASQLLFFDIIFFQFKELAKSHKTKRSVKTVKKFKFEKKDHPKCCIEGYLYLDIEIMTHLTLCHRLWKVYIFPQHCQK